MHGFDNVVFAEQTQEQKENNDWESALVYNAFFVCVFLPTAALNVRFPGDHMCTRNNAFKIEFAGGFALIASDLRYVEVATERYVDRVCWGVINKDEAIQISPVDDDVHGRSCGELEHWLHIPS